LFNCHASKSERQVFAKNIIKIGYHHLITKLVIDIKLVRAAQTVLRCPAK